jgi:uncharacterized protein (TIGR00369 family)
VTTTPLERLRAAANASTPLVPVAASLGYLIDSVDEGTLVARLPALPPAVLRGPGVVLPLVDMVLSAAISTVLPAARSISTLTLHWAGTGPLPPPGTNVVVSGGVQHVDDGSAISTGSVSDGDGALLATVSARAALFSLPAGMASRRDPVSLDGADGLAGLRMVGGPPTWSAVGVPWLSNMGGNVQGGVLAAVAAHAIDEVVGAVRPHLAGSAADLDVTYLRPVPADGSEFTVRAEPIRTGMRLAAARAEVLDPAGRLAVAVTAAHWRA